MRTSFQSVLGALNFLAGQKGDRQKSVSTTAVDNAAAIVTIAAPGAGKCLLINNVMAGFSDVTVEKTVTVVEDLASGNSTVAVVSNKQANCIAGYLFNENKSATFTLAASGTGGKTGSISVNYSIIDTAQAALTAT